MIGRAVKVVAGVLLAVLMATVTAGSPAVANEFTASGTWAKPDNGHSVWSAQGEVLFGNKRIVAGPSVAYQDLGDALKGGSVGAAAEVKILGPFWAGAAVHYLVGDLSDAAEYTGEVRAVLKIGTGRVFGKVQAARVWARDAEDTITDPEGTEALAGLGVRW